MGSSQSSPINAKGSSKGSDAAIGGRGRKTSKKPRSAPHGLTSSVVSFPSELLNQVHCDITEEPTSSNDHSFDIEDEINDVDADEEQERQLILNDARHLKQLAVFFLHPETPVSSEGHPRCYFDRASAPEPDTFDQAEEKAAVLRDAAALKQAATDFLHPEAPVVTTDPCAFGRNFFHRPSAAGQSDEDDDERAAILAEAKALHKLAVDFMHPEQPVVTSDPTACARCYFDRPSGPEPIQDAEEYDRIMDDIGVLTTLAKDYLHPEHPVVTSDPSATARCYFERSSAPGTTTKEAEDELTLILADCAAMMKLAMDYKYPEIPISTDPSCFARCYYDRASAPEQLSMEEANEMALILNDAAALEKTAIDFLHPEIPVKSTSPYATARCYFERFSAVEQESKEDMEDREKALSDAVALKILATDYLHPELTVVTSDPIATARSYFDRPSAPEVTSPEYEGERLQVIADAKALESLAVDFLHPEKTLKTTCPFANGRNYFDRPSARYHDRMIHTFPAHEHDEIDHHHEHTDHFGMEDFYMADTSPSKITGGNVDFSSVDFSKVADELEGNLSRSPSSVMLYGQEEY